MKRIASLIHAQQIIRLAALLLCHSLVTAPNSELAAQSPPAVEVATGEPLAKAHAHNDYQHAKPLLDAIGEGFCSVEADIFLEQGKLLVGHEPNELTPERTLEALYLRPLWKRYQERGKIFANAHTLTLLIDFKSEAETTYKALDELLVPYRNMLVKYENGVRHEGAVEIILSGNRPIDTVSGQSTRWVAIDGRLSDLSSNPPLALMPLISDRWTQHFFWNGDGEIAPDDSKRLKSLIQETHQQGRRLRFWATPDRVEAWRLLEREGVDLINTDDLDGLATFLRTKASDKATDER